MASTTKIDDMVEIKWKPSFWIRNNYGNSDLSHSLPSVLVHLVFEYYAPTHRINIVKLDITSAYDLRFALWQASAARWLPRNSTLQSELAWTEPRVIFESIQARSVFDYRARDWWKLPPYEPRAKQLKRKVQQDVTLFTRQLQNAHAYLEQMDNHLQPVDRLELATFES
jgi:hypothetical protein